MSDWQLYSILIICTVLSFIPQIDLLHRTANATGISIIDALLNLVVATEQLAFGIHVIAARPAYANDRSDDSPLRIGDWLGICQFLAGWLGHKIMLVMIFTH